MPRETGRQRAQRIQIDYYRKRTGLDRWKTICIVVGLVAAGAYAAYVLAAGGPSHTSTGPVAEVHASFESDCEQCHQPFTPMDPDGATLNWTMVGLDSSQSIAHMEEACQKCHQVGDHYRDTMVSQWQTKDQNCASCHTDHQGRDVDLTRIAASRCIECHRDLKEGCVGDPSVRASVAGFTEDSHGDFASLQRGDPGKVKFDHRQHLLPGQVEEGDKGAFTLEMLDASLRERYRREGQEDSSPIQLDCSSCHQYAGNPSGIDSLSSDTELGRYLQPVSFEEHCSACHAMNPSMATASTAPIPHAVSWDKVELLLQGSITGARLQLQARSRRDDSRSTPQPGEGLGDASAADPLAMGAEIEAARKSVETECLKCHLKESISDEAIAESKNPNAPSLIPTRWFEHGLYDHAAHRQIDCKYCHAQAYPDGGSGGPAMDHEKVMIAGIEKCTGCHRPSDTPTPDSLTDVGSQPTWASDNCTLCHRYHTPADHASSTTLLQVRSEAAP